MRFAEAAVTPAVNVTLRDQLTVDVIGVERVQGAVFEWQSLERALFQVGPHVFALLHPGADFALREVVGEGDVVFPAVEFTHFQEKNAQREVTGMPRIGDVTVLLNGIDQLTEIQHGVIFGLDSDKSIGPSPLWKPAQILWG